jgi:hypothetical protein
MSTYHRFAAFLAAASLLAAATPALAELMLFPTRIVLE